MARDESAPFARGETIYNGGPIDANDLVNPNLEGREYLLEVNTPDAYTQADPTGRQVRVKVVRNVAGVALKGGHVARFKQATGVPLETQIDGYVYQTTDPVAGVIDEFLPAAGVPNNDLCYLVIDGPTSVLTVTASLTALAVGDRLQVGTGTSATNDDAGRVNKYASSPALADAMDRLGRSEVAVATTGTSTLNKCVVHLMPIR